MKPVDAFSHIDIGIPASLTSKTGIAVMTAENLIVCYENEARKILRENDCPLTFGELCEKRDQYLPYLFTDRGTSQVYGIFWMLWNFEHVRACLQSNKADLAVCFMVSALHWASNMQIEPLKPLIEMGASLRKREKEKREKRQTWNGLTREQLSTRNQKIVEHFKKASKNKQIRLHGFALTHANKYCLKPTRIKQIIKSSLDT